jgi:hypothetical protein
MLRKSEDRWHSAGCFWCVYIQPFFVLSYIFWSRNILYELKYIRDLPLLQPSPPANKHERDFEVPMASLSPPKDDSPSPIDVPRNISGLHCHKRHVLPLKKTSLKRKTNFDFFLLRSYRRRTDRYTHSAHWIVFSHSSCQNGLECDVQPLRTTQFLFKGADFGHRFLCCAHEIK